MPQRLNGVYLLKKLVKGVNMDNRKLTGRLGLSMAINYFTIKGYTVSVPLNDTQWYDLIVEKDGKFYTIQCKATKTERNVIDFRATGGTKGKEYSRLTNYKNLDFLFCVDNNLNMYLFPVSCFNNNNSIVLNSEPNKNKQGFEASNYRVFI